MINGLLIVEEPSKYKLGDGIRYDLTDTSSGFFYPSPVKCNITCLGF